MYRVFSLPRPLHFFRFFSSPSLPSPPSPPLPPSSLSLSALTELLRPKVLQGIHHLQWKTEEFQDIDRDIEEFTLSSVKNSLVSGGDFSPLNLSEISEKIIEKITSQRKLKIPKNIQNSPTLKEEVIQRANREGGDRKNEETLNEGARTETHSPSPSVALNSLSLYPTQLSNETRALDEAVKSFSSMQSALMSMQLGSQLKPSQRLLLNWFEPLENAIQRDQQILRQQREKAPGELGKLFPFALFLTAPEMTCIAMNTAFDLCLSGGSQGVRFVDLVNRVGTAINLEVRMAQHKGERASRLGRVFEKRLKRLSFVELTKTLNQTRQANELVDCKWDSSTIVRLGSHCVNRLLQTAKINVRGNPFHLGEGAEIRNAFEHELRVLINPYRRVGYVKCHPNALGFISKSQDLLGSIMPKLLPMVTPPKPWRAFDEGGYLSIPSKAMRIQGSHLQQSALKKAKIDGIYECLDFMGNTKWKINAKILSVVESLWALGGGVASIPSREDLPMPTAPSPQDPSLKDIGESDAKRMLSAALRKFSSESRRVTQSNLDLFGLRCDFGYKLEVAQQFRHSEIFFPFNMDFRGRTYPIPPHLNHIGNDLSRGLLLFAVGKPLGPKGLRWLKIHLANQWGGGVEKSSFDQRVQWVDSHTENIVNTVNESIPNGWTPNASQSPWWLQAEKPFQFLAAAMELSAALSAPNSEEFLSHVPIQMDGSCNGLQHYAALGRDAEGGAAVNLVPSERPQDVYTEVLRRVKMKIHTAAVEEKHPSAILLDGHLSRKIIKQTVMTSVYGVTTIGARDQIAARLREIPSESIDWGDDREKTIGAAALFVAVTTLNSLFEAFSGARRIQHWLGDCATRITMAGQPVSWTTPLGLPVIQPYRSDQLFNIRTALQSVMMYEQSDLLPVSKVRQKSAFPPNFIHSLDATHMMMTAKQFQKRGLTFSSVHDSFWTHAADTDTLHSVIRETFVELYSQPILERVRDSWIARFPQIEFLPVPNRGDLQLEEVKNSPYFFS